MLKERPLCQYASLKDAPKTKELHIDTYSALPEINYIF